MKNDGLGNAMQITNFNEKQLVRSGVENLVESTMKCTNFVRHSQMTQIIIWKNDVDEGVMKSMDSSSYTCVKVGKIYTKGGSWIVYGKIYFFFLNMFKTLDVDLKL